MCSNITTKTHFIDLYVIESHFCHTKERNLYDRKRLSTLWNKNFKTQEIGLLICIWKNKFADGEVDFATCVDKQGKKYNIN